MAPWPLWIQGQGAKGHRLPLLVLIQSLVKRARPGVTGRDFLETCFLRERKLGNGKMVRERNDEKSRLVAVGTVVLSLLWVRAS